MWPYGWTRMFIILVVILINQFLHCESRPSRHSLINNNEDGHLSKALDIIPRCQSQFSPCKKMRVPTRIARNSKLLRSSTSSNSSNNIHNNNQNGGGSTTNGVMSNDETLDLSSPPQHVKSPVYRMRFRPGRFTPIHHHLRPLDFNHFSQSGAAEDKKYHHHQSNSIQDNNNNNNNNNGKDDDLSSSPSNLTPRTEVFDDDDGGNNNIVDEDPDLIDGDSIEENINAAAAAEAASFTPYISPRALSNMGKFFEHLQENILAAMLQQERTTDEIGQPSRRRMMSSGSLDNSIASSSSVAAPPPHVLDDKGPNDLLPSYSSSSSSSSWGDSNTNSKQQQQQDTIDLSSESSETGSLPNIVLPPWPAPTSRFFRTTSITNNNNHNTNNHNNNNKGPANSHWSSSLLSSANGRLLEKMQGFLDPLTIQEEELKRTSYYNPSWLWTNMGLGRR